MSLKGVAAVVGLAERAPQRYTGNETNLDLLSGVAIDAMTDAGIDRTDVDQPARLTKNAPAASGRRRSSSSGARDQIRIHRKHCFRYPFEVCDLSYSSLADRSYSQPTGYSPLFRWQENPNPRKINELRLSHRRGAATSGQKMSWGRQTAPRRQRRRPYPERQSGRRWIRGNFHLDPSLIKTGPVDPLMECPDQSVRPIAPYRRRCPPWG